MSAGADPDASKTTGAANVIAGHASPIAARAMTSHACPALLRMLPPRSMTHLRFVSGERNPFGAFRHLSVSARYASPARSSVDYGWLRGTFRGETFVIQPRISGSGGGDRPHVDSADAAMERYASGDEAAFGELYDAFAPRLLGVLRRATRDASVAEDLMQLTLLHMHRARGSFIPGAPVMPWAFAIARRLMTDHARRRRVELRLFSEAAVDDDRIAYEPAAATAAADEVLHARRLEVRLQQRIDALPELQRTAYRLLQQEGLSLKSAADVLGTSVTAVKLRAHRAYVALRAVLRETGEPS